MGVRKRVRARHRGTIRGLIEQRDYQRATLRENTIVATLFSAASVRLEACNDSRSNGLTMNPGSRELTDATGNPRMNDLCTRTPRADYTPFPGCVPRFVPFRFLTDGFARRERAQVFFLSRDL